MTCKDITPDTRKLCIGKLDKPVYVYDAIQKPPLENNQKLQVFLSQNARLIWCAVKTISGNQFLENVSLDYASETHKFYARYDNKVKIEHRLIFNNKIFRINSVESVDEDNRFMIISANGRQNNNYQNNRI